MEENKSRAVVSAPAVIEEKKGWNKVASSFVSKKDKEDIKDYIVFDVVIPTLKKTIQTIVTNGVSMLLFGDTVDRRNANNDIPVSRVSYRTYYNEPQRQSYLSPENRYSSRNESITDYNNILLQSRGDWEMIFDEMEATIARHGFVKIADLCDFAGLTSISNYTDNYYGWRNLGNARHNIFMTTDGRYGVTFPKAIALND